MELLPYLAKSSLILGLFGLVYFVFLKKETLFNFNRHFLLLGILTAICLPFLVFTQTEIMTIAPSTSLLSEGVVNIPANQSFISPTLDSGSFKLTSKHFLLGIYALGFIVMLIRVSLQLKSLLIFLRKYPRQKKEGIHYVQVQEDIAPFSIFHIIVFNPILHKTNELEMILEHERQHALQRHSIDIMLCNLLLLFQWFNPFAWWYKKLVEENLEFLADRKTAQKSFSKKAYQLALLKASSATIFPTLTHQFYQSFIKKRIIMLNKVNSKKRSAFKSIFILPLLALFLYSFNVKTVTEYVTNPLEESPSGTLLGATAGIPITTSEEITIPKKAIIPSKNNVISNSKIPAERQVIAISSEEKKQIKKEATNKQAQVFQNNKDLKYKITKNTTDAELEEIKKELKASHGINFNYATVRNSANEITSLSINYSGEGRNGNFQEEDEDGIQDVYFYMGEDGRSGFYSEESEERRIAREERLMERREERDSEREIRLKERLEERREEMEVRREEMDRRREELRKKRDEMREEIIISNGRGRNGRSGNVVVISDDRDNVISIYKTTSDNDLAKMKKELASKGVNFNYKKIKRNNNGEITGLKIMVDDGQGSKATTEIKSDDEEGIDPVIIKY